MGMQRNASVHTFEMFKKIGDGGSLVSSHDSDVTERWYPIKCSISDKYVK